MSRPAILVMARAPRRHEVRRALEDELGADRCLALHATLLVEAVAWAWALDPRAVYVAFEPSDAGRELQRLVGDDVLLFPQSGEGIVARVGDAVGRVMTDRPGPLLVVWPDLPQLKLAHGRAAMADLDGGADVVLGPVFDGGFYLIGVARQVPSLWQVGEEALRGPGGFNTLIQLAYDSRLEVGLLQAERALRRPADIRAVQADPVFGGPVAKVLGRG